MSASTARKSLVRATEEGERRWFFGGGLHIWKATADDTDGAFLLFEDRVDYGKVKPLHLHPDSDETMIVLQGEILMHLDGAEHTVRAGGIASAPRGIPHAFKVSGAGGARLLCLHTPGCCQEFYWTPANQCRAMTAAASTPGRWTWVVCRPRPTRTAASRFSVRPRSATSLRADFAGRPSKCRWEAEGTIGRPGHPFAAMPGNSAMPPPARTLPGGSGVRPDADGASRSAAAPPPKCIAAKRVCAALSSPAQQGSDRQIGAARGRHHLRNELRQLTPPPPQPRSMHFRPDGSRPG